MATTYVVLQVQEYVQREGEGEHTEGETHDVLTTVEATNAEQARRKAAEQMDEADLEAGVTLIAVPERNWRTGRGTLKAETTRRIRSA
jgi:hypothetical protein